MMMVVLSTAMMMVVLSTAMMMIVLSTAMMMVAVRFYLFIWHANCEVWCQRRPAPGCDFVFIEKVFFLRDSPYNFRLDSTLVSFGDDPKP